MRRPVLQPRLSLFWRALPPALCLLLATLYTPISAQIAVPDRLPDGRRMTAFTTPAEFGHLPFDSLRTLPPSQGGRDTWWHRHALFSDGALQLALDPIVDISLDRRRLNSRRGRPHPARVSQHSWRPLFREHRRPNSVWRQGTGDAEGTGFTRDGGRTHCPSVPGNGNRETAANRRRSVHPRPQPRRSVVRCPTP